MQIRGIHTQVANELRKTDSAARKAPVNSSMRSEAARSKDSAGISPAGLRALTGGDSTVVSAIIEASPDVRTERIAQVKKRIADGFYNTAEFTDQLADKLAQEFGSKKS